MKQWWREWYNKYAVLVAVSVLGFCGSTAADWSKVEGQTWAAWVQAVGAIAAICGAYFIGERQAATARIVAIEAEQREEKNRLDSILAIMSACEHAIDVLNDEYENTILSRVQLTFTYDSRVFDGLIRAITSINLHDLRTPDGIAAMISAQQALTTLQAALDEFSDQKISTAGILYGGPGDVAETLSLTVFKSEFRIEHHKLITALQNR